MRRNWLTSKPRGALLALALLSTNVIAADPPPSSYKWYPGSPMLLGRGFIQSDLSKNFTEDCVTYTTTPVGGPLGDDDISLEVSFVTNYTSLLDKMGLDVEVEFHSLAGGGDAKFQQQRSKVASSKNVSIVVSARAESPQVELRDVTLKKPFADMLDTGDIQNFLLRCGSRLPYIERRGVMINAVITISDASEDLKSKVTASISGKYGSGPVGGSARASFDAELNEAKKNHKTEIAVTARGGDASDLLENTIKAAISENQSIDAIGQALASYAKTLKGKPARLGFQVGDMPRLASVLNDPWSNEKQRKIGLIFDRYRAASEMWFTYDQLGAKRDPRHVLYSPSELDIFRARAVQISSAMTILATQHASCKSVVPPDFGACDAESGAVDSALALPTLKPLRSPTGQFAVAVRRGPKNLNAELKDWELLDENGSKGVLRSAVRPSFSRPDIEGSELGGWEQNRFGDVLRAQVNSTFSDNRRHALIYLVEGDRIESVEAFAEVVSAIPAPSAMPKPLQFFAHGIADLDARAAKFDLFFAKKVEFSRAALVPVVVEFGHRSDPFADAPAPSDIKWFEYEEQVKDQLGDLRAWPSLGGPVRAWTRAGLLSGTAKIKLRVFDKFSGESVFDIGEFAWDSDPELAMARVEYSISSTKDRFVWFAKDTSNMAVVGYPSIYKPLYYKVTNLTARNAATKTAAPFKTKWTDLEIIACNVAPWTIKSTSGSKDNLRLTTNLTPNELTLSATYSGPGAVNVEFDLGITGVFNYAQPGVSYVVGDPFAYCGDYRGK